MNAARVALEDVAVIVAAKNESATIEACVESLQRATKGGSEIVVVDDASTDDSVERLERYASSIRLIRGPGHGPGRARNLGMSATQKTWIAFTDGDCEVDADWLERLCVTLSTQPQMVASVGGRQVVSKQAGTVERQIAEFLEAAGFVSDYLHESETPRWVPHNPTCNVLYDRRAIETVGGFDEELWPCEDLDLDLRLAKRGFRFLYDPRAVVAHRRPSSWRGFGKMMHRYGFAHAQLIKKHGVCQKLHLLPLALPILLVGAVVSALWAPWMLMGALPTLALVGTGASLWRSQSMRAGLRNSVIGCFAAIRWLCGFYAGLRGSARVAVKNG